MFLGTRSFTTSHGGEGGGGVQVFENAQNVRGGNTGLAFYVRVVKLYYD